MDARKHFLHGIIVLIIITTGTRVNAQVPDNNTFDLDTVVKTIQPSSNTLQACFDEASSKGFDPTYEGSHDRLSNFRNYDHYDTVTTTFQIDNNGYDDRTLYNTDPTWSIVQGASYAHDRAFELRVEVSNNGTVNDYYEIRRAFVTYLTGDIPNDANILDAYMEFRVIDNSADYSHTFRVVQGSQSSSLPDANYDAYSTSSGDVLFGVSHTTRYEGDQLILKKASVQDTVVINKAGATKLALIHTEDVSSNSLALDSEDFFDFWLSGESTTGSYMETPQLFITYERKNPY